MPRGETANRGHHSLLALVACLALLGLPLAGCGDDDGDGGGAGAGPAKPSVPAKRSAGVDIASFKVLPDRVRVRAGGTVTWTNQDKAPHSAQTDDGSTAAFDTDRLDLGERKAVELRRPGTFRYFCIYHRFMKGTVEVVE